MTLPHVMEAAVKSRTTDLHASIESARLEISRLHAAALVLAPFISKLPTLEQHDNVRLDHNDFSTFLSICLSKLDSLKDDRLAKVLEVFLQEPWSALPSKDLDDVDLVCRTFPFQAHLPLGKPDKDGNPRPQLTLVNVVAVVRADSPHCRKVLVCERPVTTIQKVFETVCA